MYNRYQGNSGQVERMPDAPHAEFRPRPSMPPAAKQKPPPGTTGGGLQRHQCIHYGDGILIILIDIAPNHLFKLQQRGFQQGTGSVHLHL